MLRVTVTRSGDTVLQVQLSKDEILIGRGDDVDVSLPSEAVSRRHARLQKLHGGWQLSDLGAANGVYVLRAGTDNVERIVVRALAPGDRIQIENFVLRWEETAGESPTGDLLQEGGSLGAVATTARTQFISMVDVLAARDAAAAADAAASTAATATASATATPAQGSPLATRSPHDALGEPRQATAATTVPPAPAPSATVPPLERVPAAPMLQPGSPRAPSLPHPDTKATGTTTSSGKPATKVRSSKRWRVRVTSDAGHDQSFVISGERATVGAGASCDVVLPSGPPLLLELARVGSEVELQRRRWWPFPKIMLDDRRVSQGVIAPGDVLRIGIFVLTVHLRESG